MRYIWSQNVLKAAMLSLDLASQRLDEACFDSFIAGDHLAKSEMAARLYIDNNAVIAFINKGRVKWSSDTISIFKLFKFLKQIELYRLKFSFVARRTS